MLFFDNIFSLHLLRMCFPPLLLLCGKVASLNFFWFFLGKFVLFEELMPALRHIRAAQEVPMLLRCHTWKFSGTKFAHQRNLTHGFLSSDSVKRN